MPETDMEDRLGMTITLCQRLIDQIDERLAPLFIEHLPASFRGNGTYRLDLNPDADPWIIKTDTSD